MGRIYRRSARPHSMSAIGVVAGSVLGNYLPLEWIKRVAAVAFIVIGVLMLAGKFSKR